MLQGIKAGPAAGVMSTDKIFVGECLAYLREQVRIVQPRLIVTLGEASAHLCRKADRERKFSVEIISIMHPSARARNWAGPYDAWIEAQARLIRAALR